MTETPVLPNGDYDLIYADPPWRYRHSKTTNRKIENHYPTLDLEEIKSLNIPAKDDSVCYLWTTAPKLAEGIDTLREWGFDYRTSAVWDKQKLGMGYWFRVNHEHLLVGVKGNYKPPNESNRRSSIFHEERGNHSEKPKKVRRHIEQAHPDAKKLELFSRDGRVGWDMWGNETVDHPQQTFDSITD